MNERVSPFFEEKITRAALTPDPSPEFARQLWQRMTAHSTARGTQAPALQRILRRPGWALVGLVLLGLILGTVVVGPQRVLAALQKGMGYVRWVGFVDTAQAMALREPVELSRGGQTLRVEQLISSEEETVLTVRLLGFPAYQDVGLDDGLWLILADGHARSPGSRSIEITGLPGEYIGVFKFHSLPAGTSSLRIIWQPQPDALEWQIPVELYPLTDAEVARRLPGSFTPKGAASTYHGVTLRVDQVASSANGTAVRLQISYPDDLDYALVGKAALSDERGQAYPMIPQVHFADQGQQIRSTGPVDGGQAVLRNLQSTYEFQPVQAAAGRLTLTVESLSFGAAPDVRMEVDLGLQPAPGDVFPIDQSFALGELTFRVRQARLISMESNGRPLAGLVLDIQPVDPEEIQLEQVWLFDTYSDGGILVDSDLATWTEGWPLDQIPTGRLAVRISGIRGTILGEWQMNWEHSLP